MKKIFLASVLILGGFLALGFTSSNFACNLPMRDAEVCNGMRHLRTNVHLLGAQRDLMQLNYEFIEQLSKNMVEVIDYIFEKKQTDDHMTGLDVVKTMALEMQTQAGLKDVAALGTANMIESKCQACHTTGSNPPSGYSWDTISRYNWDFITKSCNTPVTGRVPYRCKQMYGMLKVVDYFWTALALKSLNYPGVSAAAKELQRIASDLEDNGIVHKKPDPIEEEIGLESSNTGDAMIRGVRDAAKEIVTLADLEDPLVGLKMRQVTNQCMQCHGVQEMRGPSMGNL